MSVTDKFIERFKAKYYVCPERGCWIWIGAKDPQGYGVVRYQKRYWKAHRAIFEHLIGSTNYRQIRHTCKLKKCVNPEHLIRV